MTGAPTNWQDGIALLEGISFQLRRLLPDADASNLVTQVEAWLDQVRADYAVYLERFASVPATDPPPVEPAPEPEPVPAPPAPSDPPADPGVV